MIFSYQDKTFVQAFRRFGPFGGDLGAVRRPLGAILGGSWYLLERPLQTEEDYATGLGDVGPEQNTAIWHNVVNQFVKKFWNDFQKWCLLVNIEFRRKIFASDEN